MTAQEWLSQNFSIVDDEFSPMFGYMASVSFFVSIFGSQLEDALNSGSSIYNALMETSGGTRGWEIYFDDWKQRGLIN